MQHILLKYTRDVVCLLKQYIRIYVSTVILYWSGRAQYTGLTMKLHVCQQPPMTFTTEGLGQPADEDIQKVIPGRDLDVSRMNVGQLVVERYLEPTLKYGRDVMERGRVCSLPAVEEQWARPTTSRYFSYFILGVNYTTHPYFLIISSKHNMIA